MAIAPLLLSLVLAAVPPLGLAVPTDEPAKDVHDVIYMETRPSKQVDAVQQLRAWALQQRRSQTDQNLILLRELDRCNQFLVLKSASKNTAAAIGLEDQSKEGSLLHYKILPDFILKSEYLAGSKNLSIPLGALVMVAHIDADPLQSKQTLLQLEQLGALMPELKGNHGIQILTWRKRPNHWTLISVWTDSASYSSALEDARLIEIRTAIATHAAAPADLRLYRRIE